MWKRGAVTPTPTAPLPELQPPSSQPSAAPAADHVSLPEKTAGDPTPASTGATGAASSPAAALSPAGAASPAAGLSPSDAVEEPRKSDSSGETGSSVKGARQSEPVALQERITLSWKGITVKTVPKGRKETAWAGVCSQSSWTVSKDSFTDLKEFRHLSV